MDWLIKQRSKLQTNYLIYYTQNEIQGLVQTFREVYGIQNLLGDQELIIFDIIYLNLNISIHEQDHELKKQFDDFKHSGTHKQQIIIYSHLFQLLINYGYKYRKLPLCFINQLKQKVQLIESSNKHDNFQSDIQYQLLLDIQEFIEIQQPTKEDYEKQVTHPDNLKVIEELEREINQFSDIIGKIMMQIFDNELFKSNNQNEDQTVSVCELLLDLADKNFYQLKIIEIVEFIIQDYQIQIDQKTYLAVYICYITGNYDKAFRFLRLPKFDDIKKTPKFLLLQGDHIFDKLGLLMRINLEVKPIIYFDQAIKLRPYYINAYIEKGVSLTYKNKFRAIHEFEKCLQMIGEVYFFKGICHFWLQKQEEYEISLKMFEYGLLLQPNFKFGELLKCYALQKLGRQNDQQVLLEKLSKFNENYDVYMMNHSISVASKVRKLANESYLTEDITHQDIRNIRNIILIASFYKIDCLQPQEIESIQQRFNSAPAQDQTLNNQYLNHYNNYHNQFILNNYSQTGCIQKGQIFNFQGQQFQQQQAFFCQHCGQLNKPVQKYQMDLLN